MKENTFEEPICYIDPLSDFGNIISDNPTFCIVELGIFAREKKVPKTEQEILAHVFNNMRKMTEPPMQASGNSFFETIFRRCNYKIFGDMEKDEYKKSIWEYADVQSGMELVRDEAFQDGMEKGRAEGKAEGMEKGIAEGEAKSKTLIARNMLSEGIDIALISKITGLTEEEIKGLGFRVEGRDVVSLYTFASCVSNTSKSYLYINLSVLFFYVYLQRANTMFAFYILTQCVFLQ